MEIYFDNGFTVYFFGFLSDAAIIADCCLVSLPEGFLKYCLAAASIPKTPLPISETFRYISRILFLPQTNSIINVKYASSPFLNQLLPCHRKTFFATC